jgi:hypothetical protein
VRVAVRASAFVLPLDGIRPRTVAAAMAAGIDLHTDSGAVWSAQGMTALLRLRERAEVIVTDAPADLVETLLGWGVGVTGYPLASMSGVACVIDCPPLMLNEAAATSALEAP